jgi:hypothetical protein
MEVGMKRMFPLVLACVGGCTAQPPPPPPAVAVGGPVNCIDLQQVTGRRVLAPNAVLFDVPGGISYRAELQSGCVAHPDPSLIVQTDSRSGRLCRDDRVRIYDPVEAKATGSGPYPQCRVIGFTPVPTP